MSLIQPAQPVPTTAPAGAPAAPDGVRGKAPPPGASAGASGAPAVPVVGADGATGATGGPPKPPRAVDLAAVARERSASLKAKQATEQAKAQIAADRAAIDQQKADVAKREQQMAAFREKLELLPKEPEKALELLGLNRDEFFRRVVAGGEISPDEKVKALEAKHNELIQQLQKRDQADQQRELQRQQAAAQAQERGVIVSVAKGIIAAEDRFPNMTELYDEAEISAQLHSVNEWAKSQNVQYSAEEVADFLEKRAAKVQTRIQERKAKRASAVTGELDAEGSQLSAPGQQASGHTRTLTNKGAAAKASPAKKVMTEEEQDAWALAELRKATALDRKAKEGK